AMAAGVSIPATMGVIDLSIPDWACVAKSLARWRLRVVTNTCSPSLAKRRAQASPIPPSPPVTRTVRTSAFDCMVMALAPSANSFRQRQALPLDENHLHRALHGVANNNTARNRDAGAF